MDNLYIVEAIMKKVHMPYTVRGRLVKDINI